MGFLTDPLKRLKWGFIPTRREVEDEIEVDVVEVKSDEKADVSSDSTADGPVLELRDELQRKWYKFFDEYEYRLNSKTRSQHKWFKWFNETDTAAERKLITKLDILLTFYSLMAYWVKYLDQTNINNAYIGGMKEGVGMKGNDLVNVQVMFKIGNIIFQIPFMYALYGLPLNFVLPALDVCWSILTVCIYKVEHVGQLKAIVFFVGAFEAPAYLAYQYLFGCWYKVDEMARRSMIYYFGQFLGLMTSGLLSGAIERHLDGANGLAAWQWIFIVDGILSIVVGFIGFYVLPGTPTDCYSIFLSDDEIRLARKRLKDNKTATRPDKDLVKSLFSFKLWKRILGSWEIYVLSLWNIFCWNNNNGTSGSYVLWINSLLDKNGNPRYGKGKKQDYTALTPGLGLLWLFITCTFADLSHSRWGALIFSQVFNLIGNILLAVWHIPERAKWFAFCLQYFGWAMAPVLYSWQNDICRHDAQIRAVVLVWMNMLAQSTTAWTSVLVWKTVEAPRYLKGYSFTAACALALSLWTFVVLWFYKRTERQNAREQGIVILDSESSEQTKIDIDAKKEDY